MPRLWQTLCCHTRPRCPIKCSFSACAATPSSIIWPVAPRVRSRALLCCRWRLQAFILLAMRKTCAVSSPLFCRFLHRCAFAVWLCPRFSRHLADCLARSAAQLLRVHPEAFVRPPAPSPAGGPVTACTPVAALFAAVALPPLDLRDTPASQPPAFQRIPLLHTEIAPRKPAPGDAAAPHSAPHICQVHILPLTPRGGAAAQAESKRAAALVRARAPKSAQVRLELPRTGCTARSVAVVSARSQCILRRSNTRNSAGASSSADTAVVTVWPLPRLTASCALVYAHMWPTQAVSPRWQWCRRTGSL